MKKIRMIIVMSMVGLALMLNTSCDKEKSQAEIAKCEFTYQDNLAKITKLLKANIISSSEYQRRAKIYQDEYIKCLEEK